MGRGIFSLIGFALAAMAAPVGAVEPPEYAIAAIEYAPTPTQVVGSVKAGLLCLPKGKLRWRDVALPRDTALSDRLADVLRTNGLSVAARPDPLYGDAPPVTAFRLRVAVESAKLRVCQAYGISVGQRPSSKGEIAVRWDVFDSGRREQIDAKRFVMPIDSADGDIRSESGLLSTAIEASAMQFAATRRAAISAR